MRTGDGATLDKKKAYQYYLAAARSGLSRAMCNIGYMLRVGDGIEQNKDGVQFSSIASLGWKNMNRQQGEISIHCL